MSLAAKQGEREGIEAMGWDELVAHKRKLSNDLKGITDKIVNIDRNQMQTLSTKIRELRSSIDDTNERARKIHADVHARNSELMSVSEKVSQSKNFLSIMESRLPPENEEILRMQMKEYQEALDAGKYKSERERNEILSRLKEASMKVEAIKATRVTKDQFVQLMQESGRLNSEILQLEGALDSCRTSISESNGELDRLYDAKRKIGAERESMLVEYDRIAREFDVVNGRLDAMAEMRRKQRQEYGHRLPNDALFKIKEDAKRKLESGEKLSFDELKLLYGEQD